MADDDLPTIAEKAINSVLRYHDSNHRALTVIHKSIINDRIEALLPLKPIAADLDIANLEIVADAAISFLQLYNLEHLDNPVNEKWLYVSVQSLASIDLKPSLVRGRVPRIPDAPPPVTDPATNSPGVDRHEAPQREQINDDIGSGSQNITHDLRARPASKRDSSTQDEPGSDSEDDLPPVKTPRARKRRSNGPQVANAKDPWGDEEIKKLIKGKAQGMTHKEVGALLGRTEPACAIRHSIVLKQDKWVNFAKRYREKRAAGEDSDVESENEVDEEVEQAQDDEEVGEDHTVSEQIVEVMGMNQDEDVDKDHQDSDAVARAVCSGYCPSGDHADWTNRAETNKASIVTLATKMTQITEGANETQSPADVLRRLNLDVSPTLNLDVSPTTPSRKRQATVNLIDEDEDQRVYKTAPKFSRDNLFASPAKKVADAARSQKANPALFVARGLETVTALK